MTLLRIGEDSEEVPVTLARFKSNSIKDHYSMLRKRNSNTNDSIHSEISNISSNNSLSLSSVNKVIPNFGGNIMPKSPTSPKLTTEVTSSIKSKLKKTYKSLFHESAALSPTEGPLTKNYNELLKPLHSNYISSYENCNAAESSLEATEETLLENPELPEALINGLPLIKVTRKNKAQKIFKIDLHEALVIWNNGKRMSLDKVQEIRAGVDAKNYREEYGVSKEVEDRWASIIYQDLESNKLKALHVIAQTRDDIRLFTSTLSKLVNRRREMMKCLAITGEKFANIHWKNYISKNNNNREHLSFNDVLKMTKRLHINCDERYLKKIFDENDSDSSGLLSFEEFQRFFKHLKSRPEIIEIFNDITNNDSKMTFTQFSNFLETKQKQHETIDTVKKWFYKYSRGLDYLCIDEFTNYLTSALLTPIRMFGEDYTKPLNEYFISSSHNTYLTGRQYGKSISIEGYIKALQRGCRSIEIDIWDSDQGPVVRHGKLTGSLPIRDVFKTVRKYAFIMSPFPLFLSFEIHCKIEHQLVIRDSLLKIFGDLLLTKPLITSAFRLPSPLELKHKVLLKIKKSDGLEAWESSGSQSSFTSSSATTTTTTAANEESDNDPERAKESNRKTKKQVKIISELSELGIYASGLKFTNFSLPESKTVNHIFSFSERSFNSMVKDEEKNYLVTKHNRTYFMRVYPSCYRLKSTNFIPIKFWDHGVQMVATNWQTYDLGQQVNEAMFNVGDKSGYQLKPLRLRNTIPGTKFKLLKNIPPKIIHFQIDIISAQLLPRPSELKSGEVLSPYVLFELVEPSLIDGMLVTDLAFDQKYSTPNCFFATRAIYSNGFNPAWRHRFEGRLKSLNGLDFIRFQVKTGDLPFAVNCCRLQNLNQGYRHLPLYDMKGEEYIFSTLFINVNYEEV